MTGKSAVLATDLSTASESMIQSETGLSCLEQIGVDRIHLVTVVPSNVHSGMPGMGFEKRRKEALRRYSSTVEDAGFDVETHVVRGTPHRRINGVAGSVNADLIMVGSRGKSPLENRVIGSTARNLARTTVVPLIVDRIERGVEEPETVRRHLFKRTLFATDFSENAERAFRSFEYLRHATKEVTLVHVESPKDDTGEGADPQDRLDDLADRLDELELDARTEIRRGDPADEILAAEAEHDPSTLMIGSRGRSRLRRLLLGSVSQEVVARATGNVFLVPPPRSV
ncbi:universal stress protein [Halorubrum sp. Ib24]|uniref:universal stress protein n=1 Tax=Halorubrum sp. Ib24 TaxID=1383850 RepID=UPI000B991AED|nr:universal stress protein [Halorubrum sp. Ib24]OYR41741.1 universal stress protein [Halorubrum sp. Ib24]